MTQERALSILKTGANAFLTGEPGAGKTYCVNEYIKHLARRGVITAVTASTGIAATHLGGMTIHSWSGIGIRKRLTARDLDKISTTEHVVRRVRRPSVLVIDEISMLSAETLTMIDSVCREIRKTALPFGGLQTIFVGDFFQLPPIGEADNGRQPHFAYESLSWERARPIACYLSEQYRQDDAAFLGVLAAIRRGETEEECYAPLAERRTRIDLVPDNIPKLYTHNTDVDRVNNNMLGKIARRAKIFSMNGSGAPALVEALKKGCLSPETLELKEGAEVMCTKNNQKEGFVNGTLGIVSGFAKGTGYPLIRTRRGRVIEISPAEWTIEDGGTVKARIAQIPLRLAWAITVHKSQGMSLDGAAIDLSGTFEYGQGYVALSRVRRLEGLFLLGWNERALLVHPEIRKRDDVFRAGSDEADAAFARMAHDELVRLHENFISASGGAARKERRDTLDETLELWNEGNGIDDIAARRKLVQATIYNHIEKLLRGGRIQKDAARRILSVELAKALPTIHAAFRSCGAEKLSPVFEKLRGAHSYDDLRIARMFLE
ncbi:MAG: AAA family ATPase [Candidatus Vogelbacteria bacterium]|nr:AAA family ATPase [Candidatus Vogelbacteria bacterium]